MNPVIKRTVDFLNELLALDSRTTQALFDIRVSCSPKLDDHPTVQTAGTKEEPLLGILGILNGIIGVDKNSRGLICAEYNDDGVLVGFIGRDLEPLKSGLANLQQRSFQVPPELSPQSQESAKPIVGIGDAIKDIQGQLIKPNLKG